MKMCATSSQVRNSHMKTWAFLFRTSSIKKRRIYDHILVPYKDKGNIKKSTVVRDTLHESDHGLVITDMQMPHIKSKKNDPIEKSSFLPSIKPKTNNSL